MFVNDDNTYIVLGVLLVNPDEPLLRYELRIC